MVSVVAVVVAISEAEAAEVAAITVVTADPDTAVAAPEAPALPLDVMTAEDPEVAAITEHESHTLNLRSIAEDLRQDLICRSRRGICRFNSNPQ